MSYERYYLKENPFIADHPDFPLVDRKPVMRKIGRYITRYVDAGAPGIVALLGDYGIGKTFTLLNIGKKLREETLLDHGTAEVFPVYMKALPPGSLAKYNLYIYQSVVKGLGKSTFLSMLKEAQTLSDEESIGIPRILQSIDSDLANPFVRMDSHLRDVSWNYLCARPISAAESKKLKVRARIDSEQKAQSMLLEILKLLALFDRHGIVLLIDEWEYVFTATGARRQVQLHNSFKEIYDRIQEAKVLGESIAPVVFLFACTPSAWEKSIESLIRDVGPGGIEPFWQRISDRYILPPFGKTETKQLVEARLEARRTAKAKSRLYPFSKQSVEVVHEYAQGVPRRILKRCAFLLEEALIHDRDSIDPAFAEMELGPYEFV